MKLDPGAVRRRRRARALVFAGCALAILAAACEWRGGVYWPAAPLFALPLLGLAYCWPPALAAGRLCRRLAAKPLLSATLVGALALASNAAIALLVRMPQPAVHDEFSYLLAADTFAHGRLTNPTHPMWPHFESFHIIQVPSYASKYPPAAGMVLALGQIVYGHPIAGVWLSAGLACAALTWMLAGWMPGRWALAGGLLAVVHPLTIEWGQSYWGGLVPVLGGALVVGAFRRILRRPRARHAAVLAAGFGILANSRPYEGLVLAIPILVALGVWLVGKRGPSARIAFGRVVLPLGGVLAVVGSGMVYYNLRVTGEALTLPYAVYQRAYATIPLFIFQDARSAPTYRHAHLERFWAAGAYQPVRTLGGLADMIRSRGKALVSSYFVSFLIAAAIAVPLPLERSAWRWLALLGLGLSVVGLGLETYMAPHYTAPVAGLALLVALQAMRCLAGWRAWGIRLGQALVRALWLFVIGTLVIGHWQSLRSPGETDWSYQRARIADELAASGAKHLVIVHYSADHNLSQEWVYNAADLDAAPVVWAQEMDAAANARLLSYFKDRRAWLLEPDAGDVRPVPYPSP
jgi:hypothetical protein